MYEPKSPLGRSIGSARSCGDGGRMLASEINYYDVFKTSPVAMAMLTPEFILIDANEQFLEAVGRPLEQIAGRYIFDTFPKMPNDPDDPKWTALEAALASGEREVS